MVLLLRKFDRNSKLVSDFFQSPFFQALCSLGIKSDISIGRLSRMQLKDSGFLDNGEGAARAKAIARRRVVFTVVGRVLPWLR